MQNNPQNSRPSDFAILRRVLSDHFGVGCVLSPEEHTEEWQSIVREYREGSCPGLIDEIRALLTCTDELVLQIFSASASAWECDDAGDARHQLKVFCAYLETHS